MLTFDALLPRLVSLPLWLLSLSIHEWAHAWTAWRLGDDTAARMGRMTVNPIPHIDPIGTILLPLIGVPFAWAKPVPVNSARFRRDISMAKGMAITASAGPISNLVLALLSAVAIGLVGRIAPDLIGGGTIRQVLIGGDVGGRWVSGVLPLNVSLALFNLIPVPPLDGSRIVAWLMPYRLRDQWHALERYGTLLLLAVFWFGGQFISGPIFALTQLLLSISRAIA